MWSHSVRRNVRHAAVGSKSTDMLLSLTCVVASVLVTLPLAIAGYPGSPPSDGCTSESRRMTCVGVMPETVPRGIIEVVLLKVTPSHLNTTCVFCRQSWANIQRLSISGSDDDRIHILRNDQFNGLDNLVGITLSLTGLRYLPAGVFAGLGKVTILEMSDCQSLSVKYLSKALANRTILPNVSRLVLHNLNTIDNHINEATEETIRTLTNGRNITEFEFSDSRVMVPETGFLLYPLCETLTFGNISNMVILKGDVATNASRRSYNGPCRSLETIDISGIRTLTSYLLPIAEFINKHETIEFKDDPGVFHWIENTKTIYAHKAIHLVPGAYVYIYNSTWNLSLSWDVTHLDISNNAFKWLDGVFVSDYIRLDSLYLSHNDMEYVTPVLFQQSIATSLKTLDLSHNMLGHMLSKYTELQTLFSSLKALEVLNLSHNNFTNIPDEMFIYNKNLNVLDLSNNKLTEVTFTITKLTALKYFDISANRISMLDSATIHSFIHIYAMQISGRKNTLRVNIHTNPLQCSSCATLEFVRWMVTSPAVVSTDGQYTCESDNRVDTIIDEATLRRTQYLCDRDAILRRTILMATLIPAVSVTMIVLTVVYIVKSVKRKRIAARAVDRRKRIENDDYEFKYPVFLSYSNNDYDVVFGHLYPAFQHQLRAFCRTDRDVICRGDRHFRPGQYIADEAARCLEMSAIMIVVMSKNFCQSEFCTAELQMAYQLHKPMLIISIEQVPERDMPRILRQHFLNYVRIKYVRNAGGDYDITPEWNEVCHSIMALLP